MVDQSLPWPVTDGLCGASIRVMLTGSWAGVPHIEFNSRGHSIPCPVTDGSCGAGIRVMLKIFAVVVAFFSSPCSVKDGHRRRFRTGDAGRVFEVP